MNISISAKLNNSACGVYKTSFGTALRKVEYDKDFKTKGDIVTHSEDLVVDGGVNFRTKNIKSDSELILKGNIITDNEIITTESLYGHPGSKIKARKCRIGKNLMLKGQLTAKKKIKIGQHFSTFKDSRLKAKSVFADGNARLGGIVEIGNKLNIGENLSNYENSTTVAKRISVNGDAIASGTLIGTNSIRFKKSLLGFGESLIITKKLSSGDKIDLLGKLAATTVECNSDVCLGTIDKLNRILLLKSKCTSENSERILQFSEPLNKISNKVKVGLAKIQGLVIKADESIDVLNKFEFHKLRRSFPYFTNKFTLGKAISAEQMQEFVKQGFVKILKST